MVGSDPGSPATRSDKGGGEKLRHLLEAALFFSFVGLVRLFDLDRGSALGGAIGRLFAPLGRRPRAYEHLATAFPEIGQQEATRILDGMYEGLGRMLAEIVSLEHYARPEARERFTFEGVEHYRAALATGRPVLLVSGHFGNWEMQVPVMHHLGIPFADVTQPLDNPHIDRFLARRRHLAGFTEQIERGTGGARRLIARIKRGETVALMIDLRFGEGIPVPFFGRPALTTFTPALFAQSFNAIVLPMALRREEGARFRFVMQPPIEVAQSGNPSLDIIRFTTAINAFAEAEIHARPQHWMWNHRRWRPPPQLYRRAAQIMGDVSSVAGDADAG